MTAITILASRLEEAHEQVAKANRKLERAGIAERFELTVGETIVKTHVDEAGVETHEFKVEIELNTPQISFGGWTFIATIVAEGDDLITRTVPGQELNGWAPKDARCDHCGTVRYRNETYIVRNEAGEVKQVGSSCIRLFLGISPESALWALTWELDTQALNERDGGYLSSADKAYRVERIIRLAWAITDGGKGYVSKAAVDFNGGQSTAGAVFFHFDPDFRWFRNAAEKAEAQAKHYAIIAAAELVTDEQIAAVKAAVAGLSQDTDYGRNMNILINKEFVGGKSVGMVASALSILHKDRVRKAEKAAAVQGFIGEVGEKLSGIEVVVTDVKAIDGNYGTTYLYSFRTADGHVAKWFASRNQDLEIQDKAVIAKATVKAQDAFRGQDQTVLTRVKFV